MIHLPAVVAVLMNPVTVMRYLGENPVTVVCMCHVKMLQVAGCRGCLVRFKAFLLLS